jgi:hypothetical protein
MKECKHLIKYTSKPETWTCGEDVQGTNGKSYCGIDLQTNDFIVYEPCPKYEPVEKSRLSIAGIILRDAGFRKVKK